LDHGQRIVALVFALEHRVGGYSWSNAVFGAFVGSLLFGMASLATRGLALPIGLHAAWNFGQWIIGEKESPGLWKPAIPGGPSASANDVALISYVAVRADYPEGLASVPPSPPLLVAYKFCTALDFASPECGRNLTAVRHPVYLLIFVLCLAILGALSDKHHR